MLSHKSECASWNESIRDKLPSFARLYEKHITKRILESLKNVLNKFLQVPTFIFLRNITTFSLKHQYKLLPLSVGSHFMYVRPKAKMKTSEPYKMTVLFFFGLAAVFSFLKWMQKCSENINTLVNGSHLEEKQCPLGLNFLGLRRGQQYIWQHWNSFPALIISVAFRQFVYFLSVWFPHL